VPDQMDLRQNLDAMQASMEKALMRSLTLSRQRLNALSSSRVLSKPEQYFVDRRTALEHLVQRLGAAQKNLLMTKRTRLAQRAAALDAMSPLKVLSRGYAVSTDEKGAVLRSVKQTGTGESIHVRLADGELEAEVKKITEGSL